MFKLWLQNNFHPFIIYAFLGSIIAYPIILLIINKMRVTDPKAKIKLLFLPLIIPIVTYTVAQVFKINTRCLLVANNSISNSLNSIWQSICNISDALATVLTPLFLIALGMAIGKALISIFACRRLLNRYGIINAQDYPELTKIVRQLANQVGIDEPGIIVTNHSFAKSFTFGILKPKIVVSQGILTSLDEEELETVMAHEIAHIIRKDALFNWVAVFLRDLMFFAPVTYWVFNSLIDEKEKATDDITMALTEKPLAFASSLIKVWRHSPKSLWSNLAWDNFSPNPGLLKKERSLQSRVERIIKPVSYINLNGVNYLFGGVLILVTGTLLLVC